MTGPKRSMSPLPLWERSDRIDRCDPGEGLRSIDRPRPLSPTLSHKGRGSAPPPAQVLDSLFKEPETRSFETVIASQRVARMRARWLHEAIHLAAQRKNGLLRSA